MNPLPLVTIVIPVFNQRADFLRQCIDSALAQSYPNLEILVSDNHSNNGTSEVILGYVDPRLRVVNPPHHLTMIQNFTFAASQAHGELLSFLPSDDWLEKDWLNVMQGVLARHPAAAFVYCDLTWHAVDSGESSRYRCGAFPSRYFTDSEAIHHFGKLICRNTSAYVVGALIRSAAYFKSSGWQDAGISYAGDACLGLDLLKHGGVAYENQALANYRVWTAKQGKAADTRVSVFSCRDMAKIYDWAESDAAFRAIAHRAGFSFFKARLRITAFFLLAYIKTLIDDPSDIPLHEDFQDALKTLSRGWLPKWVTSIFRTRLILQSIRFFRGKVEKRIRASFL